MKNNHWIRFNCNYLPSNFNEWYQSNIDNNYNLRFEYDGVSYYLDSEKIYKNDFTYIDIGVCFIVIESYDSDIEFEYGGCNFCIGRGRKFFPIITGIHRFKLKLQPNLKFYKCSFEICNNELFHIIWMYPIIYDNILILNINGVDNTNDTNKIVLNNGLSCLMENMNYEKIDENDFYFGLNNKNKISIFDKYIQNDAFTIVKY